ncbi:DUF1828 domain-containing protein [Liquorilactobacillus mali]|uniref:DUF1828 domain-containing protein n=1 Tax=Liquorilactobacillus mali TaxID=1618 RepID=UPI00264D488C|nr:DUF1828 domain-containing protein [Liquorilactobacillus mali]MDN7144400.1 DUF1828 domain-containing protein [Liquorilactobacillus mali]
MAQTLETKEWISQYTEWLNQNYTIQNLEQGDEITTPFTNTIGDNIRIYVKPLKDNLIELSDDGNTLNDLDLMGIDMTTSTRNKLLVNVLNQYNIKKNDDILKTESTPQNFPIKKQELLQTLLRVDDLFMTKKSLATDIFLQEVLSYFEENNFGGLPDYSLDGNTGNNYRYNYALGPTKKRPLTLFQIMNNPSFQRLAAEAYALNDISQETNLKNKKPKLVIIYNSVYKIKEKSKNVTASSGIDAISWNNKEKLKNYL